MFDDPAVAMPLVLFTPGWFNRPTLWLLGVVLSLLFVANIVGQVLKRQPASNLNPAVLRTFNLRVRAWWMMCAILIAFLLLGYAATVVLFGVVSFWALREFITMTPTRRGDHRTLFWVFFFFTPLQYVLVGMGNEYYGLFSIMIPVYASLFIPARIALSGDYKRFLERSAKISAGLLICVYALSHAPAVLDLDLTTAKANRAVPGQSDQTLLNVSESEENNEQAAAQAENERPLWVNGSKAGLLFYFVLVVQLGDVFQYVWGQLLGHRVIAPEISASRTWEGVVGGVASTTVIGSLLWWVTPFRIWEAALISTATALMGVAGGLTMSAVKRDRGVRDTGTLVQGHAGVLDRIDSLCFAAPVFFHLTSYFCAV
jgi:phosphatidate cytidylyltransferase